MGKFKKGVRVRLIEDHDDSATAGMVGTIVGKDTDGDRDVVLDDFTEGRSGSANDGSTNHWWVPKSKLEVVVDEAAKAPFAVGDRVTAQSGEQVTIDSAVDGLDHVWVVNADDKRWRAPVAWFTAAWVPKVGERVVYTGTGYDRPCCGTVSEVTDRRVYCNDWTEGCSSGFIYQEDLELVSAPANDNTLTLTLNIDSKPAADALRAIAAVLSEAADKIAA